MKEASGTTNSPRRSLVDAQGRLLAGPKLLDVLLTLGTAFAAVVLWHTYRVPFEKWYFKLAEVFLPEPVHILANTLAIIFISAFVFMGSRRIARGVDPPKAGWSLRTTLLLAGLWVWGLDVALAALVYYQLLSPSLGERHLLQTYLASLFALNGAWFTLRLKAGLSREAQI